MSKQIKIAVAGGLIVHGGKVLHEVIIREPSFRQYLDVGDVLEIVSYPNGMRIPTINNETVSRYIDLCIVEPKDPILLEQGGMALAKQLRETIIGFFHPDKPEDDGLKMSGGTSSSEQTNSPPAM